MPVNPKSLENLRKPWTSEDAPAPQTRGGMSLRKWVNVFLSDEYKQADLEAVRDDVDEPVVKRGAARACLRLITDDDQLMKTLETLARESEGRQTQKLEIANHQAIACDFVKGAYNEIIATAEQFTHREHVDPAPGR